VKHPGLATGPLQPTTRGSKIITRSIDPTEATAGRDSASQRLPGSLACGFGAGDDYGSVDVAGQSRDGSSELGVGVQLVLLDQEVVVSLLLLEGGLAVLTDHHEGRQEECLERDD
jgi:hypothetical protein